MSESVILQLNGSGLGGSLALLIFLLVPGYISLKVYLYARYQENDYETFDKWLYSAMFGVISLSGLALIYRLNPLALLIALSPSHELEMGISIFLQRELLISKLPEASVLEFIATISTQTAIGAGVAYKTGKSLAKRSDRNRTPYDLEQPWETAFKGVDNGDLLRVFTRNEREIEGQLHQSGSTEGNYDLLLRKPTEITYRYGNEVKRKLYGKKTTDVMYFRHRDISHVQFVDYLLPDLDAPDETQEDPEEGLEDEEPVDLQMEEDDVPSNENAEDEDGDLPSEESKAE